MAPCPHLGCSAQSGAKFCNVRVRQPCLIKTMAMVLFHQIPRGGLDFVLSSSSPAAPGSDTVFFSTWEPERECVCMRARAIATGGKGPSVQFAAC